MKSIYRQTAINIFAVVITHKREELLSTRALPAIIGQIRLPDHLIIVTDGVSDTIKSLSILSEFKQRAVPVTILENNRSPGAAGAWNTAIQAVYTMNNKGWVALLDDDDEWKPDHLALCEKFSVNCNVVISGIDIQKDAVCIASNLLNNCTVSDFLAGNPGWQGSNTFIRVDLLREVHGFDEHLLCTHDRDLAIRILSNPNTRMAYTGKITTSYFLEKSRESLTLTASRGKQTGLLQFYYKHFKRMDPPLKDAFLTRAEKMFGLDRCLALLLENQKVGQPFNPFPTLMDSRLIWVARRLYRKIRIHKWATKIMGPHFTRSRSRIEIDITYRCNLKCINCNRSCTQAPSNLDMDIDSIRRFVTSSIEKNIYWKVIRILGGEPTLHPNFEAILYEILRYKIEYPEVCLVIVTNGYGDTVKRALLRVPPHFYIENSQKQNHIQEYFEPFNCAPMDDRQFTNSDFRNGCSNLELCGIGLGPTGYFPCSLSAGIDRVLNTEAGRKEIPSNNDKMHDLLEKSCRLCGRFKSGYYYPKEYRERLITTQMSPSWHKAYQSAKERAP